MKLVDLVGRRFGRLIVVERAENDKFSHTRWRCECECGNTTIVKGAHLRGGHIKSCGCLISDLNIARNTTHGLRKHPLYNVLMDMKKRCYNPKMAQYNNYGGRGISVCYDWLTHPDKFIEWGVANGWEPGLSIDRIDNDSGYRPDNCRWVSAKIQNRNKQKTIRVTHMGEERTLCDLTDERGLPYSTVYMRIKKLGWPIERALTEPVRKKGS